MVVAVALVEMVVVGVVTQDLEVVVEVDLVDLPV
jgi:hypothetical protein